MIINIFMMYNEINNPYKDTFSDYFDRFNIFYIRNYCRIENPDIFAVSKKGKGFDEGLNLTKVPSEYRVFN